MDEIENRIRKYVEGWLKKHHNVGESAGGSGHLGSVSWGLQDIELTQSKDRIIADVEYEISVETEFTYYPDNPPKFTKYKRKFEFDVVGELNRIHDCKVISTNMEFDLPDLVDDED
ncbi:MAG: hypothetical protein ACTSQZ_04510 [Candidatus Thorarchaeota archaeon]